MDVIISDTPTPSSSRASTRCGARFARLALEKLVATAESSGAHRGSRQQGAVEVEVAIVETGEHAAYETWRARPAMRS